jgi:hypothetical protein
LAQLRGVPSSCGSFHVLSIGPPTLVSSILMTDRAERASRLATELQPAVNGGLLATRRPGNRSAHSVALRTKPSPSGFSWEQRLVNSCRNSRFREGEIKILLRPSFHLMSSLSREQAGLESGFRDGVTESIWSSGTRYRNGPHRINRVCSLIV